MVLTTEVQWIKEFEGKTPKHVRAKREGDNPVPYIYIEFTDGSAYEVDIKGGLFFEACMYNTVRKAQPVERILFLDRGPRFIVEVKARSYPMFVLRSFDENRKTSKERHNYMPFTLRKVSESDA